MRHQVDSKVKKTYNSKDDEHTLQCVTINRGYGSPQTSQSFTLGKQWRSGRGVETVKEALTRLPPGRGGGRLPISHSSHLFLRKKCRDKEMYNEYETKSSIARDYSFSDFIFAIIICLKLVGPFPFKTDICVSLCKIILLRRHWFCSWSQTCIWCLKVSRISAFSCETSLWKGSAAPVGMCKLN